jgi:hypothetical protein
MELSDATGKITSNTTGIDPGTFRLVVQCLTTTPPQALKTAYKRENRKGIGSVHKDLENRKRE